jgi:hypothetical protein
MVLIVSTTIFHLPIDSSAIAPIVMACQICDSPLKSNTLAAKLSCCNTTTHAKCLSKWVDKDKGFPTASVLPKCPACRVHFSAAGYHDAMTDIACDDITIEVSASAKEVRKIELMVTPVELLSLQYSSYEASRPRDRVPKHSML